ncbi:MAG: hypothetical protein U0821_20285 [Chloroflexota bacterium]
MLAHEDYELRLLVDPNLVLDGEGEPSGEIRDILGLGERQEIAMQFLDTARLDLDGAGWLVRVRAFSDEPKTQFTFKRRYPVDDDLDAVLAQAAQDGFADDSAQYEAQIEWGLERRVLSVSLKLEKDLGEGDSLALPGEGKFRELCVALAPDRLKAEVGEAWLSDVFACAHRYGPARGDRWKGESAAGGKLSVEVWSLRGVPGEPREMLVEVSAKEKKRGDARDRQEALRDLLDSNGWLLNRDVLKTRLVLERY